MPSLSCPADQALARRYGATVTRISWAPRVRSRNSYTVAAIAHRFALRIGRGDGRADVEDGAAHLKRSPSRTGGSCCVWIGPLQPARPFILGHFEHWRR